MAKLAKNPDGSIRKWDPTPYMNKSAGGSASKASGKKPAAKKSASKKSGEKVKTSGKKSYARPKDVEGHAGAKEPRKKRIRDLGQEPPPGYIRRKGSRYFLQQKYLDIIKSRSTAAQRAMWRANQDYFMGKDREGGIVRSLANKGYYDENEALNARTASTKARKLMDSALKKGGKPDWVRKADGLPKTRYILAIGADGHMR